MSAHDHRWGESKAADRVWCQVNGLAPHRAARRCLMVWQAYMDESVDGGLFVLAGYIAPAEQWAKLAAEWEEMLPLACRGPDGKFRFKMSEMASVPERMDRVPGFYRIIESHIGLALSYSIKIADYKAGVGRVVALNQQGLGIPVIGPVVENVYSFAFTGMMNAFHQTLDQNEEARLLIPDGERVDFIFDNRAEKKEILGAWEQYLGNNIYRGRYGATPRFEDDGEFLPLQAADFFAWWVRYWENNREVVVAAGQEFPWETRRPTKWIQVQITEDQVFEHLKDVAERHYPCTVLDRRSLLTIPIPPRSGWPQ